MIRQRRIQASGWPLTARMWAASVSLLGYRTEMIRTSHSADFFVIIFSSDRTRAHIVLPAEYSRVFYELWCCLLKSLSIIDPCIDKRMRVMVGISLTFFFELLYLGHPRQTPRTRRCEWRICRCIRATVKFAYRSGVVQREPSGCRRYKLLKASSRGNERGSGKHSWRKSLIAVRTLWLDSAWF